MIILKPSRRKRNKAAVVLMTAVWINSWTPIMQKYADQHMFWFCDKKAQVSAAQLVTLNYSTLHMYAYGDDK